MTLGPFPLGSIAAVSVAAAVLPACTASVTHPTKTAAEMQVDIEHCTQRAHRRYWMDPVAALYRSYDCLEARGYRRDEGDFAAQVDRALGERQKAPREPPQACRVPCRRR
ncbi:MAG TPA: hypothetical protein VF603_05760 [Allosphingosinicella sp.]|jgi:hypothetical protein